MTKLNISKNTINKLTANAIEVLNCHYDEEDRIDDAYIEGHCLFVCVNRGNVGSGTIEEQFSI